MIVLEEIATVENFDEAGYLAANPDVAAAVRAGHTTAIDHLRQFGLREGRRQQAAGALSAAQAAKIDRLEPLLDLRMEHTRRGIKYDFLSDAIRAETGIAATDAVSVHGYDRIARDLVEELRDGWVLDCGAGKRSIYYPNVVNYEIVDYPSTDILGVAEHLPFKDGVFDGVLSIAVLEHVRDPFRAASEIVRVLKPGGRLVCAVPFLQPLHGYPHHYYNMTHQGLRALFERSLEVEDHRVLDSLLPVWSLNWILQSWVSGLSGRAKEEFLSLRVEDLLRSPNEVLGQPWVRELSPEKNFELASGTLLLARKPAD